MAVYLFHFLGKRRYTLDQIEREEFTEETESERPESEPEVSLTQTYIEITHDPLLFSVLRKEYFNCPQKDSHSVHYI
jgi:hypothetical protein